MPAANIKTHKNNAEHASPNNVSQKSDPVKHNFSYFSVIDLYNKQEYSIIILVVGFYTCRNHQMLCFFILSKKVRLIYIMKRSIPVFIALCMIVTCLQAAPVHRAAAAGGSSALHLPGEDLEVAEGWDIYKAGQKLTHPVTVAVIDTGIDVDHPDLASHIWTNSREIPDNGIDDDSNGYVDDIYGWDFYNDDNTVYDCEYTDDREYHSLASDCDDHGTHVAGIIAAAGNGTVKVSGLASVGDVRIMTLKIHGGRNRKGKLSDAIKAIKYAESMGALVCNISWGTYTYSDALASAISHSGMLFVCAAGNDGTDNDSRPIYPASFGFPNVISVGFTDHDGELTYSSNYGKNTVHMMVPCTDVTSTVVGGYGCMGGSSMAAAHVSAIAALLYAYADHTWAASVKSIILNNTIHMKDLELFSQSGGIPSLKKTLQNVGELAADTVPPSMELSVGYDENGIALNFTTHDEGGSGVCRINYLVGSRTAGDFNRGTVGMVVENDHAYLSKGGTYSFFVQDAAGNSTVYTLPIMDDVVRPVISGITMNSASDTGEIVISANVSDLHSGVRSIKYMRGIHEASDFRRSGSGTVVEADEDGNVTFAVPEQGTYTIYVSDYRGNQVTATIRAYNRPYSGTQAWGSTQTTVSLRR